MDAPHINGFDLDHHTLGDLLTSWNLPAFRTDQVLNWVYQHHTTDPNQMANLSKQDRETLANRLRFDTGRVLCHQEAADGVQKLLIQWPQTGTTPPAAADPSRFQTECVMIPAKNANGTQRHTACVSSQAGCPVGCTFCASGLAGLAGNLSGGQIIEQVWRLAGLANVGHITHVVFMGMGEPLANLDNVVRAIHTLMASWGFGISGRRITVSTVGLPAQIRRLAKLKLPVTLAISLHAPNDPLRRKLIPWAQHVSIEQLTEAGRYYFDQTQREVTLEYILLGGVNDRPRHAHELVRVAKTLRANVNLIRYNEVDPLPFVRPDAQSVHRFQNILRRGSVNTHLRASRGRDIAAACGQLRHEHHRDTGTRESSGQTKPFYTPSSIRPK